MARPQPACAIIIGAGAAGLAAARTLAGHGIPVELLDARGRLGGRIHTLHDPHLPVPIEAGAEFVHGLPPETWQIIRSAHLAAADVPDTHWHLLRGRLRNANDFWSQIQSVLDKLPQLRSDMSFAQFLKTRCRHVPASVRALTLAYVEGFNAADANRISAKGVGEAEAAQSRIEADRTFRLLRGYDGIIRWLADSLAPAQTTVHLNTIVQSVRWKPGSVRVQAISSGTPLTFTASRAIITLPIGVLQAAVHQPGAIQIQPDPPHIRSAINHLAMGPVLKIAIRFRENFWERDNLPILGKGRSLRDVAFLHSQADQTAFPTWWTMLPVRSDRLVGWAGGPPAARLAGRSSSDLLRKAIADLSRATGLNEREIGPLVQSWQVFDWPSDPFARGAYSYVPVGGLDAVEKLARPAKDTLFFAGEATHPEMSGTVAGALASGYRAARQVLDSL